MLVFVLAAIWIALGLVFFFALLAREMPTNWTNADLIVGMFFFVLIWPFLVGGAFLSAWLES